MEINNLLYLAFYFGMSGQDEAMYGYNIDYYIIITVRLIGCLYLFCIPWAIILPDRF